MKILCACEESQAVCKAFRALGHDAFSCDVQPCSGGHPEWHIQDDVLNHLDGWDLIIAFPPCTYMTNASAMHMRQKGIIQSERYEKMLKAKDFFLRLLDAPCEHISIENPTPMKLCGLPPCTQAIQPYWFGHPYSKRTCLWLKKLPKLEPTVVMFPYHEPYVNGGVRGADGKYKRFPGRHERDQKVRSKTFPGVAAAMAQQWGAYLDGSRRRAR